MSMHFAPQWVKPIKPSGTAITPTAETTPSATQKPSNVPFPALSSNGASNAHPTAPGANQPLSYSRATHAPQSPAQPTEGSYFPYSESNGAGEAQPHPFRYSREQILALWDEEKVKETPVELTEILGSGGVLTASSVVRPVGLRELNDVEKKLLSTSIHPPNPVRRQPVGPLPSDPAVANGPTPRRTLGSAAPGKDVGTTTPGRGAAGFGGFGRGEGGAFGTGKIGTIGGGLISPSVAAAPDSSRMPGSIGGGFGGVGRRGVRRTESGDAGSTWRAGRNQSGNFEGVLGFGSVGAVGSVGSVGSAQPQQPQQAQTQPQPPAAAPAPAQAAPIESPNAAWKDKTEPKEEKGEVFGSGGGPGWGTGQKKWRIAAGLNAPESETRSITVPYVPERTDSVAATASGTPLPERDAALDFASSMNTPIATPQPVAPPAPLEKEDLGAIEWYYRDPNAQEQGPFTGSQMHEWYSHSYFTDDLPLRRSSEKSFHTLAELKASTGNAVQPFLSPVRPRLPPNLPIGQPVQSPGINGVSDQLRHMGLNTPSVLPQQPAPFNQYMPDRSPFGPGPNQFGPHGGFPQQIPSPGGPFIQSPGQWGAPRINSFGTVGMSPIGQPPFPAYGQQPQHSLYSPNVAALQRDGRDLFSPSVGVGAQPRPASPWGVPGPQPQAPYGQVGPSPGHWQPEPQAIQPPYQQQQQQQPSQSEQPQQPQQSQQSYFPPTEEIAPQPEAAPVPAAAEPTPEPETSVEEAAVAAAAPEPVTEKAPTPVAAAPEPKAAESPAKEIEEAVAETKATEPKQPPPSVWGKKTTGSAAPSRKSSVSTPAAAAAAAVPTLQTAPASAPSKLPPAPASLPAKPVTSAPAAAAAPAAPAEPAEKAVATPEKPAISSRPAPWAEKEGRTLSTGPSLREIQEAEAREAEARKAARVAASSPAPASSSDDVPTSMTWGLPTSNKSTVSTPAAVTTPSGPAWGGGESGPKKTLKQIQEEEEKRKAKSAQAAQASRVASTPSGPTPAGAKRGYADLAATQQPPGAGWTTVGAAKSAPAAPAAPRPSSVPAKPVLAPVVKTSTPAAVKPKPEETGPSVDFIRWCHTTLTGLSVNVDEMIQLLLTFPINASEAERQTIAEMVYENSSTLDGRRFAQEFITRRKADSARTSSGAAAVARTASVADVVKSVPKKSEDAGFRVVKAKGKKKN